MKNLGNFVSQISSRRKLVFLLMILVALLVGVFLLSGRENNQEISRRLDGVIKSGDCTKGLQEFEKTNAANLEPAVEKKLLQYRVNCYYRLSAYDEALAQADRLSQVYKSEKASESEIQQLESLKMSITSSKKTEDVDRQNEQRIKKELEKGNKDTYDGPLL